MKYLVVSLIAMLSVSRALAGSVWEGSSWKKVEDILAHGGGDISVYAEGAEINPFGCSNSGKYVIDKNNASFNTLYALLLTAYSKDHLVQFLIRNDRCGPYEAPEVYALRVSKLN
ncbi:hypothetical protein ACJJH9_11170 [Microbulbifer sp. DLAB2-AF]|uniref:hypothetical protein n=1 Tax=Microbulbifer sp. DLAB2-AF TaxID=3243395 RepID=UPI004039C829